MSHPEQHYHWSWELASPPEALWPLVSNTDRFNRDCGYPTVQLIAPPERKDGRVSNARRLRATAMGFIAEWDEHAFEWVAPLRFGVERRFYRVPFARMRVLCELTTRAGGGTTLNYQIHLTPAGIPGRLIGPVAIGHRAGSIMERVFRRYDEFAQRGLRQSQLARRPVLSTGGLARLEATARALAQEARMPEPLIARLREHLAAADDLTLTRMRPYALADAWRSSRRDTLHLFLHAARAGLLDFSWDLVCPHCRGAKAGSPSLGALKPYAHCDSCDIDFTANFDQSVELTFAPNAAIRSVVRADYCIGGPQVTPHVVAQQSLEPGDRRTIPLALAPGRYRVRTAGLPQQHVFRAEIAGNPRAEIHLGASPLAEHGVAPDGELVLVNSTGTAHLAMVEHLAWSDQATTAAEVTSLQLFRDLFSREVLRPGEQIGVASMTVVFTDLKNSTQLYREIGDAPAFGRVLTHFEILKACVAAEDGAIVKTMGDAIMAVFPRPVAALRAMLRAHDWLLRPDAHPLPPDVSVPPSSLKPLALKAGLHCGPCLVINQNDRLDYFGTTVNITARLCGLCTGSDLILSNTVRADPEAAAHLADPAHTLRGAREQATLRGFGDATFEVWRVTRTT